jgi:hypothetical protein
MLRAWFDHPPSGWHPEYRTLVWQNLATQMYWVPQSLVGSKSVGFAEVAVPLGMTAEQMRVVSVVRKIAASCEMAVVVVET